LFKTRLLVAESTANSYLQIRVIVNVSSPLRNTLTELTLSDRNSFRSI